MLNTWQFHYVDVKIINSVSWTSLHKRHNHELQAVCFIFIFSICALYKKGVLTLNTCNIFGFLKVKGLLALIIHTSCSLMQLLN
jgi:hypothetical protein